VRPSIVPFLYSKRTAAARSPGAAGVRVIVALWTTERFVAVLSELAVELPPGTPGQGPGIS